MKAQDIQTLKSIIYELVEEFFKQETYEEDANIDAGGMWLGSRNEGIQIYVPLAEDDDCFIGSGSINNIGILFVQDEVQVAKLRSIANDISDKEEKENAVHN